jgi:hypothetical protein
MVQRLVAARGLDREPACLELHRTKGRSGPPASPRSASQPIYRRSVSHWKNDETALADLFTKLPIEEERIESYRESARQSDDPTEAMASLPHSPA